MRAFASLAVIAALPSAFATIYTTSPIATTQFNGGQTALISWQDDGQPPSLSTIGTCSVGIYAGNSQQQTLLQDIVDNVNVATTASIQFTIDPTIGPDSNVYFIRYQSLTYKDPTTNNLYPYEQFSARFTLGNMSGTFNSTVQAQINGAGTSGAASPAAASSTKAASTPASQSTPAAAASPAGSSKAATPSTTSAALRGVRLTSEIVFAGAALAFLVSLL